MLNNSNPPLLTIGSYVGVRHDDTYEIYFEPDRPRGARLGRHGLCGAGDGGRGEPDRHLRRSVSALLGRRSDEGQRDQFGGTGGAGARDLQSGTACPGVGSADDWFGRYIDEAPARSDRPRRERKSVV